MLLNCGVGEDSWESLGLQGDPTSPFEGDQPWDFFGRNDAKAETPVLWPPHVKSWLIGKYSDAGREWGQEEKGTAEDEMAGWHHGLDGHESEWTPGDSDGQGGLACCDSWGHKESDTIERLNWTEHRHYWTRTLPPVFLSLVNLFTIYPVFWFRFRVPVSPAQNNQSLGPNPVSGVLLSWLIPNFLRATVFNQVLI